jgi:hypothetical protein
MSQKLNTHTNGKQNEAVALRKLLGGLCVQTTLGFGKLDFLEKEIRRVLGIFRDGGLLYCTSHFVQDHCSMDELDFTFSTARRLAEAKENG